MEEKAGVLVTKLDLSFVQEVRDQLPLLRHRRTDVYTLEEKGKSGKDVAE
jgi:predicted amidohydrolase